MESPKADYKLAAAARQRAMRRFLEQAQKFPKETQVSVHDKGLPQEDTLETGMALEEQRGRGDQAASSAIEGPDRGVPLRQEDCAQRRTESEEAEENSLMVLKEIEDILMEGFNQDKAQKHPKSAKEGSSPKARTNVVKTTVVEEMPKAKAEEGPSTAPGKDEGGRVAPTMGQVKAQKSKVQEPQGPAVTPEGGRSTSPTYLEKENQALRDALAKMQRQADSMKQGEKLPQEKQEEGQSSALNKDGKKQIAPTQGQGKEQKIMQEPTGTALHPERGRSTSPAYLEKENQALKCALEKMQKQAEFLKQEGFEKLEKSFQPGNMPSQPYNSGDKPKWILWLLAK